MKVGDRVGVIVSSKDGVIKWLGQGVFKGDEVPPADGGWLAEVLHEGGITNPKIELDTGEVVWGYQCWWGPAEKVAEKLKRWSERGWEVQLVTMADVLAEAV